MKYMHIDVHLCDGCPNLHPSEDMQSKNKESHMCQLLGKRVYHLGLHPHIVRHVDCPKEEVME